MDMRPGRSAENELGPYTGGAALSLQIRRPEKKLVHQEANSFSGAVFSRRRALSCGQSNAGGIHNQRERQALRQHMEFLPPVCLGEQTAFPWINRV